MGFFFQDTCTSISHNLVSSKAFHHFNLTVRVSGGVVHLSRSEKTVRKKLNVCKMIFCKLGVSGNRDESFLGAEIRLNQVLKPQTCIFDFPNRIHPFDNTRGKQQSGSIQFTGFHFISKTKDVWVQVLPPWLNSLFRSCSCELCLKHTNPSHAQEHKRACMFAPKICGGTRTSYISSCRKEHNPHAAPFQQ